MALAWFLPDEDPQVDEYANSVLALVRSEHVFSVVPAVWHEEVAGVLLKRLRAKRLTAGTFEEALMLFDQMPLEAHTNPYTVAIIVERARRYNLQAIDALYFDLAIALGLPIATIDGGLKTAARRFGVKLFQP